MTDETIDKPAKIIWDYLHLNQPIQKCDIIFALGSSDLRVAERAAQLFLDGYGNRLVISGGIGRISKDMFHKPEAEMFADIAVEMGVPKEKILTETKASNTGQNITFTYDLLQEEGVKPRSILIVTKPYMERRTYATFKKQWPASDTTDIFVTSPDISYEEYFTPLLTKDLVLNTMVGDLQRIRDYPARGFQIPQDIPSEVWDAYKVMVKAGYDKSLEKTVTNKIIIVNDQDEAISHKVRGTLIKEDIYRVSALWVTNSNGDILLAQRKFTKKHDPGKWGPAVAGTVDEGETYESNIIKEAEEEIGLANIKPTLGPKRRVSDEHNYFCQWYTLTVDKPAEDFTIQEEEVEQVKWLTRKELECELHDHPENYLDGMQWDMDNL